MPYSPQTWAAGVVGGTPLSHTRLNHMEAGIDAAADVADAVDADLDSHLTDTVDAHDASAISFVPNGSIAATNVQAAIQEVRDEAGGGTAVDQVGFYYVGTVATGTGTFRIYNKSGATRTISAVHIALGTSGTVTVDVHKNGTTVFTTQGNRPATSSSNEDLSGTPDVTSWADGDYLTADVDVATSGADLVIQVIYT